MPQRTHRRALRSGQRPTARAVAAQVLLRVERDKAFASASLDAELEQTVQLSVSDRRLATELVYGVLRCERYLDGRIAAHARSGVEKLDADVRAHMRVAVYQIVVLDRVPAFAAVSSAVDLVRDARGSHVARFANAVLRKIAAETQEKGRVSRRDAVKFSLDPSLVELVGDALGSCEQAYAMLCAGPYPPPLGLRIHDGHDVDEWMRLLADETPVLRIERGKVGPRALCLFGAGRPDVLPGFESAWSVQEEGSQVVAAALQPRAGDTVLDACAGRGNKALFLAEQVGASGYVDAADLHDSKLAVLLERAKSLAVPVRSAFGVDWIVGAGDVPDAYDCVLVDAPCSGMGTLRRRPDVAHRDIVRSLPALQRLQVGILSHAALRCRSGGRVVYAVCSVLRQEAEGVVEAAISSGVPLEPTGFGADHAVGVLRGRSAVRLLPHEHGTDGYFLACFRRL